MKKEYNIGLDIGTNSVGWAVVETNNQKIMKKGKKQIPLWGVRLFNESLTAEERRNFRSTRRRYDRRKQRIKLLQDEFKNDINAVDKNFYQKLQETKYTQKDTFNKKIFLNENEKNEILAYNKKYPTIYHLRKELINSDEKKDIRLVYLALHHIIKYRGNFLYDGNLKINDMNLDSKFKMLIDSLMNLNNLNIPDDYDNYIELKNLSEASLLDYKPDIKLKIKEYLSTIIDNNKFINEFCKYIVGNKFSIIKFFQLEDKEKDLQISFDGSDYDDHYAELEEMLDINIEIINLMKELYDCIFLKKLFKNSDSIEISSLMVNKYNQHKKDLKLLKDLLKNDRKKYNIIFRTQKDLCIYDKYINNKISNDEFIKEVLKYVEISSLDEKIRIRIENGEFLPRITDTENGKYPYQLNKEELVKIIKNQGKYYPFLLNKLDDGTYKIVRLLEFKIPYYVGPLNQNSEFAWLVKSKDEKITPYNFYDVIDTSKTAEKFILRMISHCTYLLNEYALPNNSILYSKFKVLNELKQIRINGKRLEKDIIVKILNELFMKTNGVISERVFIKYLNTLPEFVMYNEEYNITGYSSDKKFANNMQSYVDFFGDDGIFKDTNYQEEDAEKIIEWITIFTEPEILKEKIISQYVELSENQINKILSKKYSGWGSLSRKLLCDLMSKDKKTNIYKSIMDYMFETEENFMQIINNDNYEFQKLIANNNINNEEEFKNDYEVISKLPTSTKNKRGIYQSLKIVQELIKYIGYEPKNIMIEMARSTENTGRVDDNKKYLINIYNKQKEEINNFNHLFKELNSKEKIDNQKLYLYFIQEGKCLYTGNPINIDELFGDKYEIDHIIPRTLVKDNSIDNKALVLRSCNQNKSANFVLPKEYNNESNRKWWEHLRKIGLISAKKFYNLTRAKYSDEDIEGFINRQLVETRQITKHVANLLQSMYKDTKIIYLKASLSHDYREKFNLYKFRELNDYHHAHDAYLASVLGEYKEKYMKKNIDYNAVKELNHRLFENKNYNELKYGYVINCLDENYFDIVNDITKNFINDETGEILFNPAEFNYNIENTLYRNDILISRKTEIRSGQFYKQTIYPKNIGNERIKENMPTSLYGGYSNVENSYLILVQYKNNKKIIAIPISIAKKDNNIINNFIRKHLKLKENETFNILKDKIPFENLIDYKGQLVYIKGYSTANKNNEVSNAYELKIPKNKMKDWKYLLNNILNKGKNFIDEEFLINKSKYNELLLYLFTQKDKYPLFKNSIEKIENNLNVNDFEYNDYKKVITELLKIYHCSSECGELKDYNLGDRIGRLSGNSITNGKLYFKSVTGIKENSYEF